MSDEIRLAVIGTGQRGLGHAHTIQKCQETELVLVCDLDESRAQKAASISASVTFWTTGKLFNGTASTH